MTTVRSLGDLEGEPHANVFPDSDSCTDLPLRPHRSRAVDAEQTYNNHYESEPKTIRLTLGADDRVDPHQHPGRDIVLHLLEGAIELDLDEQTHELTGSDVVQFEGEREVSPYAVEESVALIVLAPRAE